MAATVTEIAKRSGVSKALVSRLLNRDPSLRVSPEKREKVLSVKTSLDRLSAQWEHSKREHAYNFVIPCLGKAVFDELSAHMESKYYHNLKTTLSEQGFRISIALHDESEGLRPFEELIHSPRYCDGLILLSGMATKEVAELIIKSNFPHVSQDWEAELFGLNTVFENAATGIYQAVLRLREWGHERIGFLGRHRHHYSLFVSAIARSGLRFDESFNCVSPRPDAPIPATVEGWREAAQEAFGRWLDDGGKATAMICHNDYGALGAIDAMRKRGLTPGRDISLVGFDNIEEKLSVADPILSTIDAEIDQLGRRTAEQLLNQVLYGQMTIVHERLPVKFIERSSIGPIKR